MDVTRIPFVAGLGIVRGEGGELFLPCAAGVHNHLGTLHAGAQFVLAESASGDCLQRTFPEWVGRAVPVLRDAQVKFKRPADSPVRATAVIEPDAAERFRDELDRRGRALVAVAVELRDAAEVLTCVANYRWFVQAAEVESPQPRP
jgi:acyl-coenzyme A thioesterase PaaI-like protein